MDELIIRFLQDRATPEEELRLMEWRRRSQENESYFQDLSIVWTELREVEPATRAPSAAALIRRASMPKVVPIRAIAPSTARRRPRAVLAAAAMIVILAGAFLFSRQNSGGDGRGLTALEQATGSETTMTQLSDGTIVHLGPNSTLRISSRAGAREVLLEGRAFFGVAKHSGWPFVVRSSVGEARVLGTRFEFSTQDGDARVIVLDGQVALTTSAGSVQVGAGEMSMTPPNGRPVVAEFEDAGRLLGWMGQSLVFHETPLSQAVREIEARYGAKVEIRHQELAGETISGGFKDRSFEYVLATICRVVFAQCEITEKRAVISERL